MPNTKIEMMTPIWKSTKTTNTDMLFTAQEVAKILKVNVDYVHKLRKSGILPFMKMGQFKCRRIALEKFLEDYEGKDITNPENVLDLEEGNGHSYENKND